jgi:hypothetical protein
MKSLLKKLRMAHRNGFKLERNGGAIPLLRGCGMQVRQERKRGATLQAAPQELKLLTRARSAEFLQTPLLTRLRWMRMFGDSLFVFGAMVLGWFVLGLVTGHSFEKLESIELAEPGRKLSTQSED